MSSKQASDAARSVAAMVRVHGPDPKGRKMRKHAFYVADSGDTTLSASGIIFSGNGDKRVITCASILEPFLLEKHANEPPKLLYGVEVEVLLETASGACWIPAQLLKMVDMTSAGGALQTLLNEGAWEVGWSLTRTDHDHILEQSQAERKTVGNGDSHVWSNVNKVAGSDVIKVVGTDIIRVVEPDLVRVLESEARVSGSNTGMDVTRVAILCLQTNNEKVEKMHLRVAQSSKQGDILVAMGSPFGALSPLHFLNSISVGIVSNCWPPTSSSFSLLMADIRCLPGMEGGPVFSNDGVLVGILLRPLRHRSSGTEVQLVMTATTLIAALEEDGFFLGDSSMRSYDCNMVVRSEAQLREMHDLRTSFNYEVPVAVEHAISSVVLVTVGDAWASGVILSKSGIILTNAHLLEPWRFAKVKVHQAQPRSFGEGYLDSRSMHGLRSLEPSNVEAGQSILSSNLKNRKKIRVRYDNHGQHFWSNAKALYISQGPLDVALLQLDSISPNIYPILPEYALPDPGSIAVVIGHGLFGPRSELGPSASAGVIARAVKSTEILPKNDYRFEQTPEMLETTAAVHPGASGGVIVNGVGHMIGLVTSNARHSSGNTIPHLNFSIATAALKPLFDFVSTGGKDVSFLLELEKPKDHLSPVWALAPPPHKSSLFPTKPGENSTTPNLKGSQFAKFIANKQAEFNTIQRHHREGQEETHKLEGNAPGKAFLSRL